MKSIKIVTVAVALLTASMFTGCTVFSTMTPTTTVVQETTYSNPQWAPPYYPGARYYYLPDIECYYDLSANEFIYLYDGQWNYSRTIPYMYSNFQLDNCFTVVLSTEVYRPWLHHQYYVSHYPRYYYSDYYDHSNIPYVRGFNENRRSAIYWGENDRHRARQWDDRNLSRDRQFKYQKEDRAKQKEINYQNKDNDSNESDNRSNDRNVNTRTQREKENAEKDAAAKAENTRGQREKTDAATGDRTKDNTRTNRAATETRTGTNTRSTRQPAETKTKESDKTQNTNYYGRTIGNPVKVEKQMQDKTEKTTERATRTTTTRRR